MSRGDTGGGDGGVDRGVSVAITGISSLVTNDPAAIVAGPGPTYEIADAAMVVTGGRIAWVGPQRSLPPTDEQVDVGGRAVLPGFVDSHAHLVFGGDRADEFAARMAGQPYAAGGIRSTVAATRASTDEQLRAGAARLLGEMLRQGTTTAEVKSGYGLSVADEARSVAVAAELTDEVTFLGAHVLPGEFADRADGADAYTELVTGPMLDACAPHARWVDAFVDDGAFDADHARSVLTAGAAAGLTPRVHANQLGHGPGIALACEVGAASADHCTYARDDDLAALADAGVVATLLPTIELCTRSPFPDARRFLGAGVTVALATDCNPGSGFSSSMPLVVALAVTAMRMTPGQAVWSATAGGAAALRRDDIGRLSPGARADLVVLDAPSPVWLAYRPGVPLVHQVWRAGRRTF